jgi:hypothetical protein
MELPVHVALLLGFGELPVRLVVLLGFEGTPSPSYALVLFSRYKHKRNTLNIRGRC